MAQPPATFLRGLHQVDSPFTTEEVQEIFPNLKPSSVGVYLSLATSVGLVEQVGVKKFRLAERPTHPGRLSELPNRVISLLRGNMFPADFERLVVWGDDELAPFMHDTFMEQFLVIEVQRSIIKTIEGVLSRKIETEIVPRRSALGDRLWSSKAKVFLVPRSDLHGTRPSGHGFQRPTSSRLFVWVSQIPSLVRECAEQLMRMPDFDLNEALLASPSKKIAARVGILAMEILRSNPDHPANEQMNKLISELREVI